MNSRAIVDADMAEVPTLESPILAMANLDVSVVKRKGRIRVISRHISATGWLSKNRLPRVTWDADDMYRGGSMLTDRQENAAIVSFTSTEQPHSICVEVSEFWNDRREDLTAALMLRIWDLMIGGSV
jgi:hypothetical protein